MTRPAARSERVVTNAHAAQTSPWSSRTSRSPRRRRARCGSRSSSEYSYSVLPRPIFHYQSLNALFAPATNISAPHAYVFAMLSSLSFLNFLNAPRALNVTHAGVHLGRSGYPHSAPTLKRHPQCNAHALRAVR